MVIVEPYKIEMDEEELVGLIRRLKDARWPINDVVPFKRAELTMGFCLGPTRKWMKSYSEDWIEYLANFREREIELNGYNHFMAREIEQGMNLHFLHHRSDREDAIPLILCHGWPGSFLEFLDVIPLLTSPPIGTQAFHVVIPSQPGFAFSTPAPSFDFKMADTARIFDRLMHECLGYVTYAAQGGDWGSITARLLGSLYPQRCLAVHLNFCPIPPTGALNLVHPRTLLRLLPNWALSQKDRTRVENALTYLERGSGYYDLQQHTPRTISYGLNDSPIGLLAWIGEKMGFFLERIDLTITPNPTFTRQSIFDTLTLYWLTSTIGTSFTPYSNNEHFKEMIMDKRYFLPNFALSDFEGEIVISQDRHVKQTGVLNWRKEAERGGHFAAMEEPQLFADHLAEAFSKIWPVSVEVKA